MIAPSRHPAAGRGARPRRSAARLVLATLALVLALAGCGVTAPGAGEDSVAEPAPALPGAVEGGTGTAADGGMDASGDKSGAESIPGAPLVPDTGGGRDVVVTGSATLEASDPVETAGEVATLASSLQGRIDARSTSTYQGRPWASVTVRVPPAQLDAFLQRLGDLGELTSTDFSAQDVTVQVADLQARIDSLTASIARLEELMARAESVTDLVAVETQLSARQAELEGLQAQQRSLADITALSTVYLTVRQPGDDGSYTPGLWDQIVEVLVASARAIVLVLAAALPWVIPLLLVALAVRWWLRRRTQRRRAGFAAPPEAGPPGDRPRRPAGPDAP